MSFITKSFAYFGAISIASSSFAVSLGTAPAVTFALTATRSEGGFKKIDPDTKEIYFDYVRTIPGKPDKNGNSIDTIETKRVPVVTRYGNAELLNKMNSMGKLNDGTIKGWSILCIRTLSQQYDLGVYAVKKGMAPVKVDLKLDRYGYGYSFTGTEKMTYSTATDTYAKVSASYSLKSVQTISGEDIFIDEEGNYAYKPVPFHGDIAGIFAGSSKLVKGVWGKGEAAIRYEVELEAANKMTAVSGSISPLEMGQAPNIIEGTVSTAAEVVLDLEGIGFTTVVDPVQPN